MALLSRIFAAAIFASTLGGCASVFDDYTSSPGNSSNIAAAPVSPMGRGHVYLIRGLIGEVFSRGLDTLAERINAQGIPASVHSSYRVGALAEEVIENYQREPGPIVLIGHSTGGDAAITIAQELNKKNIPVGIIFGFDPTPIAGSVPGNVELFINLFQKTNPIGGGVVKSGGGFRGRLINVDLREHSEIIHVTLDKSTKIHDAVLEEIVGFVMTKRAQAQQGYAPQNTLLSQPYFLAYVIPNSEPIQIWDSGVQISARGGDNLKMVSDMYRVPVWLLAQVNRLYPDAPLEAGKQIIVPQHMYGQGGSGGVSMYAR